MKHISFKKAMFTLLISGVVSMSYAADIYLSSTGSDTNDGLTIGTPVASFSHAQDLAADGDVIHVSGMIDFSIDPANTAVPQAGIVLTKSLALNGTSNATDGFDGKDLTRFIQASNAAFSLTLKNLKLTRGAVLDGMTVPYGGALLIKGSLVSCQFVHFDANTALGVPATGYSSGAAVYIDGTPSLSETSFKNCKFTNNKASKAGAVDIRNFAGNMLFEGCSFIANEAVENWGGSAVNIRTANNNTTVSLINCTIAKNKVLTTAYEGAISCASKSMATTVVNIINCTITENTTAGDATRSAGVYCLSTNNFIGTLNILNSIIEGNIAENAGTPVYADLGFKGIVATEPGAGTVGFKMNNSIVGLYSTPALVIPTECYPAPNHFNYLTDLSTSDDLMAQLGSFNSALNFYPLEATSPAINYANGSQLSSRGITTDQIKAPRDFAGGVCDAGSIEGDGTYTSLGNGKSPNQLVSIYSNSNNQITVNNPSAIDQKVTITVYNSLGQVLASAPSTGAVTVINKSLTPGVYIVMVNHGGTVTTKKVLVK